MAKRNIYQDRSREIKELRELRNKDRLVDFVVQLSKQVNQRFYRLEKAGVGINDTAYRYAREETIKDKPRYSTSKSKISELNNDELLELAYNLNDKISSKTSTVKGIKEVTHERLSRSAETIADHLAEDIQVHDIDMEEFKNFLINGGGDLLNSKYYDSYQIIEDWIEYRKKGLTSNEIIQIYKSNQMKAQELNKRINLKDIDTEFNRLIKNKNNRRTAKRARSRLSARRRR